MTSPDALYAMKEFVDKISTIFISMLQDIFEEKECTIGAQS